MPGITVDVGSAISGIGTAVTSIISSIKGTLPPEKQAELEIQQATLDAAIMQAQAATNTAEAASASKFTSSWRPAIGWVGALGLAIVYLVKPIVEWVLVLAGSSVKLPDINVGELYPILIGMLGLGTLRTVEKTKGVQGNH
jgi:hypothetical protein